MKLLKRKQHHDNVAVGGTLSDYNQGYRKVMDEDISNRSSSGSAISNSESCAQFGGADASDLTGCPLTKLDFHEVYDFSLFRLNTDDQQH